MMWGAKMIKNGSKERRQRFVSGCVLTVLVLVLILYNLKNNRHFLDATLVSCITLWVAAVLSYSVTRRNTDKRKQKEILESIITEVQSAMSCKYMYDFSGYTDTTEITLIKRAISNKIEILGSYAERFGFLKKMKQLNSSFDEYNEFIGDHIHSLEYLKQSKKELKRPLDIIDTILCDIRISLYD